MTRKKTDSAFLNVVAISAAVMALLLALKIPWAAIDYLMSVAFHGAMLSAFLVPSMGFFYVVFSPFRRAVDEAADGDDPPPPLLIKVADMDRFLGALISCLFTIYCFALFAGGMCQNIFLAAATIAALALGGAFAGDSAAIPVRALKSAAASCAVVALAFLVSCRTLPALPALASVAVISGAASLRNIFHFKAPSSPWSAIHGNRLLFAAAGALAIFIHLFWAAAYFKEVPKLVAENKAPGAGSEMIFTPGEDSVILLDKTNDAMVVLDSSSLTQTASLKIDGYPRDIEYDAEKNIYYVAVHFSETGSVYAISIDPAGILKKGFAAKDTCSQVNAIAVDYRNDRVLVGCDDTGEIYGLHRDSLQITGKPVADPSPSGFGIVRMLVLPGGKTAITTGCLFGPYINLVDLDAWKTLRSKYAGYLSWEMLRDEKRGLIYISLPLRSSVAVVDEKTLKTVRMLRAGFGARALAMDATESRLFIGNQIASTTDVYDLETWKKTRTFYSPRPRYLLFDSRDDTLITAGSSGVYKQSLAN